MHFCILQRTTIYLMKELSPIDRKVLNYIIPRFDIHDEAFHANNYFSISKEWEYYSEFGINAKPDFYKIDNYLVSRGFAKRKILGSENAHLDLTQKGKDLITAGSLDDYEEIQEIDAPAEGDLFYKVLELFLKLNKISYVELRDVHFIKPAFIGMDYSTHNSILSNMLLKYNFISREHDAAGADVFTITRLGELVYKAYKIKGEAYGKPHYIPLPPETPTQPQQPSSVVNNYHFSKNENVSVGDGNAINQDFKRDKITADVVQAPINTIINSPNDSSVGKFHKLTSHPMFVTVVGGLIVGLIILVITYIINHS